MPTSRPPNDRASAPAPLDDAAHARTALLYQLLETELGGVQVYRHALQCVLHDELKTEWARYLAQTERHVVIVRELLDRMGLDPDAELPARLLVRHDAEGLIKVMMEALAAGRPGDAELCATECVVHAETKDHMNWSLLGLLARQADGPHAALMQAAFDQIEPEEDEHLYHSRGWARELWASALGLPAVLPPPEEVRDVGSMAEAAEAEADRDELAGGDGRKASAQTAPTAPATKAGRRAGAS
ncbi:MAG TPA: hypothetical protein VHE35_00285 [Kofleriaceae bacterium]|nr:hypothetical protein [Kofleriaceae bacterium]